MADKIRNVFISHLFEDNAVVDQLKDLLKSKGCVFRDSSITEKNRNDAENENYIKYEVLKPRIDWAGAVVVLISPGTHDSKFVNWEIEYAAKQGKPVIGVWCNGAAGADLPPKLEEMGDAVVGWRGDRIIDALDGRLTTWEQPDGKERPKQPITRILCQ